MHVSFVLGLSVVETIIVKEVAQITLTFTERAQRKMEEEGGKEDTRTVSGFIEEIIRVVLESVARALATEGLRGPDALWKADFQQALFEESSG